MAKRYNYSFWSCNTLESVLAHYAVHYTAARRGFIDPEKLTHTIAIDEGMYQVSRIDLSEADRGMIERRAFEDLSFIEWIEIDGKRHIISDELFEEYWNHLMKQPEVHKIRKANRHKLRHAYYKKMAMDKSDAEIFKNKMMEDSHTMKKTMTAAEYERWKDIRHAQFCVCDDDESPSQTQKSKPDREYPEPSPIPADGDESDASDTSATSSNSYDVVDPMDDTSDGGADSLPFPPPLGRNGVAKKGHMELYRELEKLRPYALEEARAAEPAIQKWLRERRIPITTDDGTVHPWAECLVNDPELRKNIRMDKHEFIYESDDPATFWLLFNEKCPTQYAEDLNAIIAGTFKPSKSKDVNNRWPFNWQKAANFQKTQNIHIYNLATFGAFCGRQVGELKTAYIWPAFNNCNLEWFEELVMDVGFQGDCFAGTIPALTRLMPEKYWKYCRKLIEYRRMSYEVVNEPDVNELDLANKLKEMLTPEEFAALGSDGFKDTIRSMSG